MTCTRCHLRFEAPRGAQGQQVPQCPVCAVRSQLEQAIRLLQRYVVRLPPQSPGSTDADAQAFLGNIGRPASELERDASEEIPF